MTDRACFCDVVRDAFGAVQAIERCAACELRVAAKRPFPGDILGARRRLAFEERLRTLAAAERARGMRLA
jgi:hypothetical protein